MTTAQDVTYDMSVNKGRWFMSLLQEVVDKIRKVQYMNKPIHILQAHATLLVLVVFKLTLL